MKYKIIPNYKQSSRVCPAPCSAFFLCQPRIRLQVGVSRWWAPYHSEEENLKDVALPTAWDFLASMSGWWSQPRASELGRGWGCQCAGGSLRLCQNPTLFPASTGCVFTQPRFWWHKGQTVAAITLSNAGKCLVQQTMWVSIEEREYLEPDI